MKRVLAILVIILITSVFSISATCQRNFKSCSLINNYWGNWKVSGIYLLNGTYDEFIIYDRINHPSNYILRVKISGMSIESDKKEKN